MQDRATPFTLVPFPRVRRLMVDGGRLGRQKHLVHGLVEIDVTDARGLLRAHHAATGEKLSFSAFIMHCLGIAVAANRQMQAIRTWRDRLAIFDEVDVNTLFEVEEAGRRIIRPHIIRAVNRKGVRAIHGEIRAFRAQGGRGREAAFVTRFVQLPGFMRRLILRIVLRDPQRFSALNGTVALSAIGMFGEGAGWGIPVSGHTLQLTLGGIAQRPALLDGVLVNRDVLCVTITIDHDVVDGAPAARFVQQLRELIEQGAGLDALHPST